MSPRAMLMSHAPGFIAASSFAPIIVFVASVEGAARITQSNSPSFALHASGVSVPSRPLRVTPVTRTPNAARRSAINWPIVPMPTINAVVSNSSILPGASPGHSLRSAIRTTSSKRLAAASMPMTVYSATAIALIPAPLVRIVPRAFRSSIGKESTPA